MSLLSRSEHLMGTTVNVTGLGAGLVLEEMRRLSAILTRFAPSALTQLNNQGELRDASTELLEALRHALEVAERTSGLVTPTVLPALEAAGYSASFTPASFTPEARPSGARGDAVADWRGVQIDQSSVRLEPGTRLDLGGTAKSWIATRAARLFRDNDFTLDAGGDIVVHSRTSFSLDLEHPFGASPLALELPAGRYGIATSSTLKRAWQGGHHLIDPRNGLPLESRFVQVTVICDSLTEAEVLTKLALLDLEMLREQLSPVSGQVSLLAFDRDGWLWRWQPEGFQPIRLESSTEEVAA